jgi:hypothetical protein
MGDGVGVPPRTAQPSTSRSSVLAVARPRLQQKP